MQDRYVILHEVRSAHNVGAIFRTADAAGIKKLYLSGYTPAPIDRFGRENPKLSKTALGAAAVLPWESAADTRTLCSRLRSEGVTLIAVELVAGAVPLFEYAVPRDVPAAYIFGNEITGVPAEVCMVCDAVVALPMLGKKESLNVAVTAGIVLYHDLFMRQG